MALTDIVDILERLNPLRSAALSSQDSVILDALKILHSWVKDPNAPQMFLLCGGTGAPSDVTTVTPQSFLAIQQSGS